MMEPIVWLYRVVEADADPLRIPPRPYPVRSPAQSGPSWHEPASASGGDLNDEIPFAPCWQ